MQAMRLSRPGPVDDQRLSAVDAPRPALPPSAADAVLLRVRACGVCHTDLHVVEGDLPPRRLPITPGHQVVATVEAVGPGVQGLQPGDRVGVPWLYSTCGECVYCRSGAENLCERAQFTGWDVDGGYAEFMLARAPYVVNIPETFADAEAAPLLCAGIIGYRALRLAGARPGDTVGLVGFGASAHLALQVLRHWGCRVAVFSRGAEHRRLAETLGAAWTGPSGEAPPWPLDCAVIFAPAGHLVPPTLAALRPGGTLAINAIHMSPIPELPYHLLYRERTLRTVANATRQDAIEFMHLAAEARLRVSSEVYPLAEANRVLQRLKAGAVQGAAVLVT